MNHMPVVAVVIAARWNYAGPNQEKGKTMPRTPNYDYERKERERLKAIKKAEKQAAKAAAKERGEASGETKAETTEDSDQAKR